MTPRETTQADREAALLLLASMQAGQNVMRPEPVYLEAILELLAEEPRKEATNART